MGEQAQELASCREAGPGARDRGPGRRPTEPSPDDVQQGLEQWLLLVWDAMLGTQGLYQWGDLVQVVARHGGEEAVDRG